MKKAYPDLDYSNEVVAAFLQQFPDLPFSISNLNIHVEVARVVDNSVEVVWLYFDSKLKDKNLSKNRRFKTVIDNDFWLEQQKMITEANQ
ncbi:hypothetical protein C7H19_23775 [Aphanothece hegewaldii CCALA 016]|uniref:Uncharacterized protein n=1 Tax=Aphanothece hegewaldii CCALA 016 TaxID=2107694 RepID=A0A2T1LR18_9CHRO|nr:hypothetical protein [Aphanothece hegewaldii]PSF30534.1 hypothetical protein C7H19_23775 [Aphanothece hegewaldii CCALA 016]